MIDEWIGRINQFLRKSYETLFENQGLKGIFLAAKNP